MTLDELQSLMRWGAINNLLFLLYIDKYICTCTHPLTHTHTHTHTSYLVAPVYHMIIFHFTYAVLLYLVHILWLCLLYLLCFINSIYPYMMSVFRGSLC